MLWNRGRELLGGMDSVLCGPGGGRTRAGPGGGCEGAKAQDFQIRGVWGDPFCARVREFPILSPGAPRALVERQQEVKLPESQALERQGDGTLCGVGMKDCPITGKTEMGSWAYPAISEDWGNGESVRLERCIRRFLKEDIEK